MANIKTRARTDGGDYVIDGNKMWITNGVQADWMCVLANTGDGNLHTSKSLICVPMNSPGITIERKLDKLGMRSSDTAQIHFDNVRVPQRYRIGDEGLCSASLQSTWESCPHGDNDNRPRHGNPPAP